MKKSSYKSFQPGSIKVRAAVLTSALMLAALVGGCNLPAGGALDEPEGQGTQPAQDLSLLTTLTQQAVEKESAAPTAAPTAAAIPTATKTAPANTSGDLPSAPSEIKFRTGGTIAYLKGEIKAGESISYTFEVAAGQTLIATVTSNDQDVYFEIVGQDDGSVLLSAADELPQLIAVLPSSQVYQITLFSPTDNVYFLTVEIPAVLDIDPGSGMITIDGYLDVFQAFHPDVFTRVRYQIYLDAWSVLSVQLRSPALETLTLALTGVDDGVPYLRHVVKTDGINDFQSPISQKYYLDVYDMSKASAEYSLEIEVRP